RMHKLRGCAGILGAKAIHELAGQAEAACAAGEIERAADLATRLATQLQRLNQDAAPVLMAARAQAEEQALQSGGELKPQVLADLIDLLRQQSLSAMDRFSAISPQLRGLMSKGSYELVRSQIDNLQFNEAAEALEASQR
ncbi:MAG: Hpt domain-containing protein, partial [Burkholderiales bacterium]